MSFPAPTSKPFNYRCPCGKTCVSLKGFTRHSHAAHPDVAVTLAAITTATLPIIRKAV